MPVDSPELPTVSVVVSVYNEEKVIEDKLKNLELLDYPNEKIEFLFGSDGSTDKTNEILSRADSLNVHSMIFPERRGKSAVLNELISKAKGGIIAFCDANTFYSPGTIRQLIKYFSDPRVGAVCGELVLESNRKTAGGIGESSYWRYENFLKRLESNFHTTLGATGGVYAIRRGLYKPLPTTRPVMDDFLIPLDIVRKGFLVKYEPEALAFEKTPNSVHGEFRRKVRISASNFSGISEFGSLLHPRNGFVAFALWSHKIIRWIVPFLLIVMFIANALLAVNLEFYRIIFIAQILFLLLGFIGFIAEKIGWHIGILGIPYYFIAMNIALFVGFIKFMLGRQEPTWDVVR